MKKPPDDIKGLPHIPLTPSTPSSPSTQSAPSPSSKGRDNRKQIGRRGEELAADYLLSRGLFIRECNWRCRSGELDIIAEDGDTLVIVEVRTRRNTGTFGSAQESVTRRKSMQVRQTATAYLYQAGLSNHKLRFDVVAVLLSPGGEVIRIDHVMHAF